ncbi:(2Fe-2S)-binding protein [Nocardiopsis sp. NPDC050513]|uniref:(2Fe-2S)-binding protein n=1 Tax=Nocardiopsis sp. NPDC050513 TaxID=3364338 RepID=UPI003797D75F
MPATDPAHPHEHRGGPDHDAGAAPAVLRLTFDGRPVTAHPGQTVGAALIDAGVRSWRSTRRNGRPRGLFCGIGVCYDCLITVDGATGQRACLVAARDGMVLTPGEPARPAPAEQPGGGDR